MNARTRCLRICGSTNSCNGASPRGRLPARQSNRQSDSTLSRAATLSPSPRTTGQSRAAPSTAVAASRPRLESTALSHFAQVCSVRWDDSGVRRTLTSPPSNTRSPRRSSTSTRTATSAAAFSRTVSGQAFGSTTARVESGGADAMRSDHSRIFAPLPASRSCLFAQRNNIRQHCPTRLEVRSRAKDHHEVARRAGRAVLEHERHVADDSLALAARLDHEVTLSGGRLRIGLRSGEARQGEGEQQ